MDTPSSEPQRTLEALQAAKSGQDVLTALAEGVGGHRGEVPSPKELAEWWPQCPDRARESVLRRLIGSVFAENPEIDPSVTDLVASPEEGLVCSLPPVAVTEDNTPSGVPVFCDALEVTRRWLESRAVTRKRHPFAPLVKAWQNRPIELERRNERDDALFPESMLSPKTVRKGMAVPPPVVQQRGSWLPNLALGEVHRDVGPPPFLPSGLWDLAEGGRTACSMRGAPLAARIFVNVVLDVERERWDQAALRGVNLPGQRLGDFLRRLYPANEAGKIHWDKRRLPHLLEAFELLERPLTRVAWFDPETGDGGTRRVVVPLDVPRRGKMNDWVRFAVYLPPGSKEGPLIDRIALKLAGAKTAAGWRLLLSLAADWRRPGKCRRPLRRGKHWVQRKTWDAYDVVMDSTLVAMAFPSTDQNLSPSGRRSRVSRAKKALAYLEEIGYAEVRQDGIGRRIRPGRSWVGWTNSPLS